MGPWVSYPRKTLTAGWEGGALSLSLSTLPIAAPTGAYNLENHLGDIYILSSLSHVYPPPPYYYHHFALVPINPIQPFFNYTYIIQCV